MVKQVELLLRRRLADDVIGPEESLVPAQAQANVTQVNSRNSILGHRIYLLSNFADEELGARGEQHGVARLILLYRLVSQVIVNV